MKKKKYFISYILKLESWNEILQVETEILPNFLIFLHFSFLRALSFVIIELLLL